jgi:hypothetical protein
MVEPSSRSCRAAADQDAQSKVPQRQQRVGAGVCVTIDVMAEQLRMLICSAALSSTINARAAAYSWIARAA